MHGVRPLLMLSFWVNHRISDMQPFSYRFVNVLLHTLTGGLIFLIVRKLLDRAGRRGFLRDALAVFCAGLFLLHPVQTNRSPYVASRSECLSVLLFYAAFAVFFIAARRRSRGRNRSPYWRCLRPRSARKSTR